MTDDERQVVKQMDQMITDLTFLKAVHEAALKANVRNWQEEIEKANASEPLKTFRQQLIAMSQHRYALIDSGKLSLKTYESPPPEAN